MAGDVLALESDTVEETPRILPAHLRDLIAGAYALDGAHLLALNIERVLSLTAGESTSNG